MVHAAPEVYLPVQVRRAANLVKIVHSAAEHVADTATENAQPAPPDDDWMNRFMRFAEDASSERLQELFARILAVLLVDQEIGRASCRERVCQYGEISVVAVSLKKNET